MSWTEDDLAAYLARKQLNISRDIKARHRATQCEKKISEHEEQVSLFKVCKLHEKKYPGLELIHAIPNGGERHVAVAKKLKAEGVKAGVPDIFLPVPRGNAHGLYIELKAKGGEVTDKQWTMLEALSRQGFVCLVCYGWKNAWAEIEKYMQSECEPARK